MSVDRQVVSVSLISQVTYINVFIPLLAHFALSLLSQILYTQAYKDGAGNENKGGEICAWFMHVHSISICTPVPFE